MKKHIPNLLTLCNLLSGCAGCVFALRGQLQITFICVIVSGCFDFLDGFAARLLKTYSAIGKELDSLADLVSFGLSPALALFATYSGAGHVFPWLGYAALLLAAFSAYRLAKFNLDERQAKSFLGLPTPACAMFVIPMCLYALESDKFIHNLVFSEWFIPALSVALGLLLISEIPMLSLKQKSAKLRAFIIGSVLIVAVLAVFRPISVSLWFTAVFLYYILLNLGSLRREI